MTDHLTSKKRSLNMSNIRSKNTTPEMIVRSLLHKMGYRFRLHVKKLIGKPDIVMKKYKLVIFCHGCFWHQHPRCKRATLPKTNTEYWLPKLEKNKERFYSVEEQLIQSGWRVAVIWECEIKNTPLLKEKLRLLIEGIR